MNKLKTNVLICFNYFFLLTLSSGANAENMLQIAFEGNNFTLARQTMVKYGARGLYKEKILEPGTYACNNSSFGDPVFGTAKACYLNSSSDIENEIASQHGYFTLSKSTPIKYGANGSFFSKTLATGTYLCDDKMFGDPAFGFVKKCYFMEVATFGKDSNNLALQLSYSECDE